MARISNKNISYHTDQSWSRLLNINCTTFWATVPPSTTLSDFNTPGFGKVEKPELKQGQTLWALQVTCSGCMHDCVYF